MLDVPPPFFDYTTSENIEEITRQQLAIIADLGGGATDISCHTFRFVADDKHHCLPRLTETILGIETSGGSQKRTERFKQELNQQRGVSELCDGLQGSENDVLEAFVKGFDAAKQLYDYEHHESSFRPHFNKAYCRRHRGDVDLSTSDDRITISGSMMQRMFDPWLADVVGMLEKCVDRVKRQVEPDSTHRDRPDWSWTATIHCEEAQGPFLEEKAECM